MNRQMNIQATLTSTPWPGSATQLTNPARHQPAALQLSYGLSSGEIGSYTEVVDTQRTREKSGSGERATVVILFAFRRINELIIESSRAT